MLEHLEFWFYCRMDETGMDFFVDLLGIVKHSDIVCEEDKQDKDTEYYANHVGNVTGLK